MNLYQKCTTKPYCFLVVDATLVSDNRFSFRKNLLERISKLIMTINERLKMKNDNMILTEK